MTSVHDFSVQKTDGSPLSLEEYKGNILLIVNTASKCGLAPQFEGLQQLYEQYKNQGVVVLGFPCDQFNNQEFENIEDTLQFCQTNYQVTFPMFAKIDVNGPGAHPLYAFLKQQKKGLLSENIKWNFTKFLVDKKGQVIKRYAPTTSPADLSKDIESLLTSK
ncbi:glutathione peroxidase [Atopococcus tabaci]|uniref:glutathione peroxidase n=1 Tax=Atopococcus tabaci TaxID=269774 RepID=UPI000419EC16|nr:glutathione peroxidase [Atopococcus tabaci]